MLAKFLKATAVIFVLLATASLAISNGRMKIELFGMTAVAAMLLYGAAKLFKRRQRLGNKARFAHATKFNDTAPADANFIESQADAQQSPDATSWLQPEPQSSMLRGAVGPSRWR